LDNLAGKSSLTKCWENQQVEWLVSTKPCLITKGYLIINIVIAKKELEYM